MTAETVKPTQISKPTKRYNHKIKQSDKQEMVKLRTENRLTEEQIAKQMDISRSAVHYHLSTLIDQDALRDYTKNEDKILNWTKHQILNNLTPDKLKEAKARDLSVCFGIFNQHQRLNAGESTANISYDARSITASISELREMLKVEGNTIDQEQSEQTSG